MEFFAFRLNKVRIAKNREWGKAEVKFISMVTPDNVAIPVLDDLIDAEEDEARKKIVQAAAEQVLSLKELIEVSKVKDGHESPSATRVTLFIQPQGYRFNSTGL